jgi:hypothetical protein
MHLTLKKEATRPLGMNSLQQQAKFDEFLREFNEERPHEALEMKRPAEVYAASPRPYLGLPELSYPCTTATSSSPPAAASACTERNLSLWNEVSDRVRAFRPQLRLCIRATIAVLLALAIGSA